MGSMKESGTSRVLKTDGQLVTKSLKLQMDAADESTASLSWAFLSPTGNNQGAHLKSQTPYMTTVDDWDFIIFYN